MTLCMTKRNAVRLGVIVSIALTCASAWAGMILYSYDDAGRLTKAEYDSGGYESFAYNAAGEITNTFITPIPEPGGVGMLVLLGVLARQRRRGRA